MQGRPVVFSERVADAGQWFERGVRVEFFPAEHDPRTWTLEKAALGSYEVLACTRVEGDEHPWLDIRLRRLAHT
jgi:hypothetical protein